MLKDRDFACPGCGYHLRGIEGEKCPECGRGVGGGGGFGEGEVDAVFAIGITAPQKNL